MPLYTLKYKGRKLPIIISASSAFVAKNLAIKENPFLKNKILISIQKHSFGDNGAFKY